MISFPFDNTSQEVQDRNIDSDIFAEYLKRLTGGKNGVFAEVGTKMQVTATGGMTVKVKPGDGFIEGRIFINENETELPIDDAESLNRIDTVVVRLSKANRETTLEVVKGTASSAPSAPALTRESGVYELGLANILVKKNTANITQAEVTDTRTNEQRCGIAPVLGQIDTQGLYDQYQSSLDQFLETVQQAIDGTLAGQLQTNIDNLEANSYLLDPLQTIPSNADLNDYTEFGCWLCPSGTVAKTLKNCPVSGGGFTLRIMRGTSGNPFVQEIIYYTGDRFFRPYTTAGFNTGWKANVYTTDLNNYQGITIKKVWENASPTSIFNQQTITANMDGNVALIEFKLENNNPETFWELCKIGSEGIASALRSTTSANILVGNIGGQARSYKVTETGIKFSGSVFMYANSYQGKNNGCIPLNIYTIKFLEGNS